MDCDWNSRTTELLPCSEECPVSTTLNLIGGKWKIFILWQLNQNDLRFTSIVKLLPGVSKKVLADKLKELEDDGLIHRTVFPEVPPRVEYDISPLGRSLIPVLQTLYDWGNEYSAYSRRSA